MRPFGHQQEIRQTPFLESILPEKAREEIMEGKLPYLRCDGLALEEGEICHFADRAIYEKKIRRPRGESRRPEFGIFRSRRGPGTKDSVVDIVFEQIDGYFYVTNYRAAFRGAQDEWDRGLRELLSVKPYLNCVKLTFGKDSYKVFVPDGNLPYLTLSLLRS